MDNNTVWISVDDRLPPFNDMFTNRVLGYDGFSMKVVSLFKGHDKIMGYGPTQECYMTKVTHWQPLPPPPQ